MKRSSCGGRQRVGAVEARGRVLRRDHRERSRQRVRLAVDGHLQLGHRLEQPRLRFRRRPVQLVDEDDVGEDRPGVELEGLRAGAPDRRPQHVGREQVDGALDAGEPPVDARPRGCGPAASCRPPAGPRAAGGRPPAACRDHVRASACRAASRARCPSARRSPHAATPASDNRTARSVAIQRSIADRHKRHLESLRRRGPICSLGRPGVRLWAAGSAHPTGRSPNLGGR